jgi:hypothetical protein
VGAIVSVRMYPHTIVYFYIRTSESLVNVGSSRHKLPRHQKNSVGDMDPSGQNWSDTLCRRRHVATCRRHFHLRCRRRCPSWAHGEVRLHAGRRQRRSRSPRRTAGGRGRRFAWWWRLIVNSGRHCLNDCNCFFTVSELFVAVFSIWYLLYSRWGGYQNDQKMIIS